MPRLLCDICGVRAATVRLAVLQNGQRRVLDVCDFHYAQITRHQRAISPLEALFRSQSPEEVPAVGAGGGQQPVERTESVSIEQSFSELAREMLQRAAEVSVQWGRREVDSEHLLYVLADNDNVASILDSLGVKAKDVRAYIDANAEKRDTIEPRESDGIGVSPRLKRALELAFVASRQLGHSYVGVEHLLIGLAEVPESFAGQLLARLGLQPQALRRQVLLTSGTQDKSKENRPPSHTPQLDRHSRDLTALAGEGRLDPVIGRSSEIETMVEVLARRRKNNPVLIGEPGVGKTAVVEGLAQRMVNGDVPESLRNKRLVELNVNSMVAGAKYRGEFEERVKQVVDEVLANQDSLVLFVDEVHTIVGA
ncbi:MAG TPA: Clp protease N-terminal domain-containing protein, partial [Paraburkholderia sp.]|nr:Clp protease N-terminal domain-containing protein [Paraburkholderia sp.]